MYREIQYIGVRRSRLCSGQPDKEVYKEMARGSVVGSGDVTYICISYVYLSVCVYVCMYVCIYIYI